MLKIKDNIKLSELEKFGFKIIRNNNFESIHYKEAFFITPNKDKLIIPDKIIMGNDLNILYDLIKADIVECVEDES